MLTFDFEMTFVLLLQINETSRRMSGLIFRCIQQVHVILLSQKRVNAMSAVNTAGFTCKRIRGKMDRRTYRMTSLSARRDHHFGERVNAGTLLIVYSATSNELQPFRSC